ncbi:protein kinase [Xylariomycetidae sp. FL0641]|nr:protein kinase [Xylariomycetidae sp. FL0641]
MAAPTDAPSHEPTTTSEHGRLTTLFKKFIGKDQTATSATHAQESGSSQKPLSSSDLERRGPRRAILGLPRAKTFKRQQSETRDRLEATLETPNERRAISRAVSADRRTQLQRNNSRTSQPLPRASAPDFLNDVDAITPRALVSENASAPQSPLATRQLLGFDTISRSDLENDHPDGSERAPSLSDAHYTTDTESLTASEKALRDQIYDELENRWILNLSMHFRDESKREKFFVTYREKPYLWRRVTISLDYRVAEEDTLEWCLLRLKYQRDKSRKIYEAIRDSLQDIQFYDTVTNLKLQTTNGRLHVHVVEDNNEVVSYPPARMIQHTVCRRVKERDLEFDSHMSGFVYKVRVDGHTLIKKEIPGPDTVDEFLYEVNALNALRFSTNIIEFYGVVLDDSGHYVKGLLISFAEQGALIDKIYDAQKKKQPLPWSTREKWARQIVQGLSDIHESGFVQGDFTLSNIVIDEDDDAKIIDINRRGCPVGWEPPEATALIDSGQRISMYIGVKSDLYQLGMVLWALAVLEEEPESHSRPLELDPGLPGVPPWYRRIVENCLHEEPRVRMQATALLTLFPEPRYNGKLNQQGLDGICVDDGYTLKEYFVDGHGTRPLIRTADPSFNLSHGPMGGTKATSPGLSDESYYYPPRGRPRLRSLPSPSPSEHSVFDTPYIERHVEWLSHDDPTPSASNVHGGAEAIAMSPQVLESAEAMALSMSQNVDQFDADLEAEVAKENERPDTNEPQLTGATSLGGDAQVPAITVEHIESHAHDNEVMQDALTPTDEPTPTGNVTTAETAAALEHQPGITAPGETRTQHSALNQLPTATGPHTQPDEPEDSEPGTNYSYAPAAPGPNVPHNLVGIGEGYPGLDGNPNCKRRSISEEDFDSSMPAARLTTPA